MNTNCTMFLLAVEEMNFTKAAKRAFVTQQCLSAHIKNLEKEYGTTLFTRSPHLALTEAGTSLYYSLRKIQISEKAIKNKINDIKDGKRGEITLGINAGRCRVILTELYAKYHVLFPHVKLSIIMDDMKNLAAKLLAGKIDLFLGVDCISNKNFNFIPITSEEVYLLTTKDLLKEHAKTSSCYTKTMKSGVINLLDFPSIPIASNLSGSTFCALIDRYYNYNNIPQAVSLSISDAATQIDLCRANLICVFISTGLLPLLNLPNSAITKDASLKILRPKDIKEKLRLELITNKYSYQPYFLQKFIEMFVQEYKIKIETAKNVLN